MCISGILLATIDKVGKTCGQICALSRTRWCRTAGWLSPIAPSLLHLTASYWFPRAPASVCVSSEEREYSTQTHTHTFLASKIDAVHPSSGVDLFPRPPFYIPQCTVIWRVRQHLARLLHRFIPTKELFLLGFPTSYVRSGSLHEVFKNWKQHYWWISD